MDQPVQAPAITSFEDIILSYTTPRTEKDALNSFIKLASLCIIALVFFFFMVLLLQLIITHEPAARADILDDEGLPGHIIRVYYSLMVLILAWGALVLLHWHYLNLSVFQDDLGTWDFGLSGLKSIMEHGDISLEFL